MSPALSETPRKMLPPPTTTATSTPRSWTALISSAMARATFTSTPYACAPISASPDALSRMRLKAGAPAVCVLADDMSVYGLRD
jgi:hypothetical protein